MQVIRVTVLRDKPDLKKLREHSLHGFQLFKEKATGLYYLEPLNKFSESKPFQDVYEEGPVNWPSGVDLSFLAKFKTENQNLLKHTFIHDYVVEEALALSDIFQTRVLSAYSNDECDDFVAVAEKGELLRLHFQTDREDNGKIADELARSLTSEIAAVRIFPEEAEDEVRQYTQYEALQTEAQDLHLNPYWIYYEGEIGVQAVFSTISSEPEDVAPNLMFRNAYLGFQTAFGQNAPDFTWGEEKDFDIVDSFNPGKTLQGRLRSLAVFPVLILGLLLTLFKSQSLTGAYHWNKKKLAIGAGVAVVILAGIFADPDAKSDRRHPTFESHCVAAGGVIDKTDKKTCKLAGRQYRVYDLPGKKGETRLVVFNFEAATLPCSEAPDRTCAVVDGAAFELEIAGFEPQPGVFSLVTADRLQHCDPFDPGDCDAVPEIFSYKFRFQFPRPQDAK